MQEYEAVGSHYEAAIQPAADSVVLQDAILAEHLERLDRLAQAELTFT